VANRSTQPVSARRGTTKPACFCPRHRGSLESRAPSRHDDQGGVAAPSRSPARVPPWVSPRATPRVSIAATNAGSSLSDPVCGQNVSARPTLLEACRVERDLSMSPGRISGALRHCRAHRQKIHRTTALRDRCSRVCCDWCRTIDRLMSFVVRAGALNGLALRARRRALTYSGVRYERRRS
jgi:hypothetical protein